MTTQTTSQSITGLRFKRAVQFPRFGMEAGEVWGLGVNPGRGIGRTAREYFAAIESGSDRFPFAGGHCLMVDVEAVS